MQNRWSEQCTVGETAAIRVIVKKGNPNLAILLVEPWALPLPHQGAFLQINII